MAADGDEVTIGNETLQVYFVRTYARSHHFFMQIYLPQLGMFYSGLSAD